MRTTVGKLRHLIAAEGKVSASPEYLKKEHVREHIQRLLEDAVRSGDVTDDRSLKALHADIDTAWKALSQVPFDAWQRVVGAKPAA